MQSWLTKLEGKAGKEIDLRGRHSLYSATEKQSRGDTLLRYWGAKLGAGGEAGGQSWEAKPGSKTTLGGATHSTQLLGSKAGKQNREAKLL